MKKMIILSIVLIMSKILLTSYEKIDLDYEKWIKYSDKQQFDMFNVIYSEYCNVLTEYEKANDKLQKLQKQLKKNLILINAGAGFNLKFEPFLNSGFSYNRFFLNIFSIGAGFDVNIYNNNLLNSSFIFKLNFGILF